MDGREGPSRVPGPRRRAGAAQLASCSVFLAEETRVSPGLCPSSECPCSPHRSGWQVASGADS